MSYTLRNEVELRKELKILPSVTEAIMSGDFRIELLKNDMFDVAWGLRGDGMTNEGAAYRRKLSRLGLERLHMVVEEALKHG